MTTPNSKDFATSDRQGVSPVIRVIEVDNDVVEFAIKLKDVEINVITGLVREADDLILSELHIGGSGAHSLGLGTLRRVVKQLGGLYGVRRVVIHGGVRTTGAHPGHRPRTIIVTMDDPS